MRLSFSDSFPKINKCPHGRGLGLGYEGQSQCLKVVPTQKLNIEVVKLLITDLTPFCLNDYSIYLETKTSTQLLLNYSL